MNAPTPITFITLDGAERKFSLTNKRMLQIRQRMMVGFANGDADYLWFSCDEKRQFIDGAFTETQLTEDDFVEILPMHDNGIMQGIVNAIDQEWRESKGKSDERNERLRPTKAVIQPSTGSGSLPSGA